MWLNKFKLLTFDSIDSTNSEALRLAKLGVDENYVILSESQTFGRGRYGRMWDSAPGNLYMSILLNSDIFFSIQSELSFVASLSVYDAIKNMLQEKNLSFEMRLKWPNDIMINGAKIAGILLESIKYNDRHYLVIGMGVNVKNAPSLEGRKITFLNDLSLGPVSIRVILDSVMNSFTHYYDLWQKFGFANIRKIWLENSYKQGEIITFSDGKNFIKGSFIDIDANGAIRLRLDSGKIYSSSVGEVFFGE